MLSTSTRARLYEILRRIANAEPVTLQDRVYVHKHADNDSEVAGWLKRAKRIQQKGIENQAIDDIDHLLNNLDLGCNDPQEIFNPKNDDLGDWFSGAPSWIARS